MNIHEHQAKKLLKKFGALVPRGIYGHSVEEIIEKSKNLKTEKYVIKIRSTLEVAVKQVALK